MASKKLSSDTSLANSYKLSRGVASVARPSAPTIGTATDTSFGLMSVTFTASTLGPTASSYTLTSSSGITASGASSPITLQEATEGTYTYTVYGTNANGNGPLSSASASATVASVDPASYFPIATTTLASATASITFSSIPSTYTHLQVRCFGRTTSGNNSDYIGLTLNGASTGYTQHQLVGNGTTVSTGANNGLSSIPLQRFPGIGSSIMGTMIVDILDYSNTNKFKTVREIGGFDTNSDGYIALVSGSINTTSAITSMTFTPAAGNFIQYSSFSLYGIKG